MTLDLLAFVLAHPLITATIAVALAFDFTNGFHDSANAIATVVATKVMTPLQAVSMAAVFNFVGPFLFSFTVAATVGTGIVNVAAVGPGGVTTLVLGAVLGAILWNLATWYFGLPSSSSHALIGGLIGAALAAAGPAAVVLPTWPEILAIGRFAVVGAVGGVAGAVAAWGLSRTHWPRPALWPTTIVGAVAMGLVYFHATGAPVATWQKIVEFSLTMATMLLLGAIAGAVLWAATQQKMSLRLLPGFAFFGAALSLIVGTIDKTLAMGGLTKTVLFMVVSPILGFFVGYLVMSAVSWIALEQDPSTVSSGSKRAQLFSSAFAALMHGTNDAQKTMGVITVLLLATGVIASAGKTLAPPVWVILASAAAMGLGTLFGGWRIIRTMAARITHLTPIQGFSAEIGGGVVLVGMAQAGIPVSTTHAMAGSIMGVGATKRSSAVRWAVGRRIVGAWILTIPAAALVAFVTFLVLRALGLR
jgi:PiT family inorganic phosphate transporter